ncbi:DMT family transporter [Pricia sp. S334]|uniref:DMT family transporter n=1 Tax=Pricia mediterranea TaxID=3076079 RepID=A0ABU3L2C2_9FLAO|nr:DMT family transporter [Pricia sp. S334]MDT7827548.1 DMT family transporter [Pricia sp. S334]
MTKPRIALVVGILGISIFPVLVKLGYTSGLISAFYRMAIAFVLLVPIVLLKKQWRWPGVPLTLLAVLSGVLFGSDVAVWNIAIEESTATQASLLTNLSPIWVGMGMFLFLKDRPTVNFWIGTLVALLGMVVIVGFHFFAQLEFDRAFVFGILSGVFYAAYLLVSKKVLAQMNIPSFMLINLFASSIFLGVINLLAGEAFYGFEPAAWTVLGIQAVVCQLMAWFALNYAIRHIRTTRVSLSLLAQAFITAVLAWALLGEAITLQMVFGGIILLFGIAITFINKPLFDFQYLRMGGTGPKPRFKTDI